MVVMCCDALVTLFAVFGTNWNLKVTGRAVLQLNERQNIGTIIVLLFNGLHAAAARGRTRRLAHVDIFTLCSLSDWDGRCRSGLFLGKIKSVDILLWCFSSNHLLDFFEGFNLLAVFLN